MPKKVLIVDDSALMRHLLTSILSDAVGLEVVGSAADPFIARKMIKELDPDVITLDIEMPRMDGLEFLSKIMTLRPMPVVMISSLTQESGEATMKALELGAVDYVAKPQTALREGITELSEEIVSKVKSAARSKVNSITLSRTQIESLSFSTTEQVIAIGASTGGVQAIGDVLSQLPANCPAVLITQHMPKEFTSSFARRLNDKTPLKVKEAKDRERIIPGHVYIAPGDQHMTIARSGANYVVRLTSGEKVSGHMPSVDVLFQSMAQAVGKRGIGVILTGMGKDGAQGLMEMKRSGAHTIGQDEQTAIVYGMCGQAFNIGAVEEQLPLSKVPQSIISACRNVLG